MRRTGKSLKEAISGLLRLGSVASPARRPPKPFEVRARRLVARPGVSFDSVAELLERIEGPAHR